MSVPILRTTRYWYCPNCPVQSRTREARPHSRFHHCAGLAGLYAPLLEKGTKAKVEAVEREDYIGKDDVTLDANGRPVMAVVTTRDHGQDTAVFAPIARARLSTE